MVSIFLPLEQAENQEGTPLPRGQPPRCRGALNNTQIPSTQPRADLLSLRPLAS